MALGTKHSVLIHTSSAPMACVFKISEFCHLHTVTKGRMVCRQCWQEATPKQKEDLKYYERWRCWSFGCWECQVPGSHWCDLHQDRRHADRVPPVVYDIASAAPSTINECDAEDDAEPMREQTTVTSWLGASDNQSREQIRQHSTMELCRWMRHCLAELEDRHGARQLPTSSSSTS